MKCESLFSGKKKKKISSNCRLPIFAKSMVSVKIHSGMANRVDPDQTDHRLDSRHNII